MTAKLGHYVAVSAGDKFAVYATRSNGDRDLIAVAPMVSGLLAIRAEKLSLAVNAGLSVALAKAVQS